MSLTSAKKLLLASSVKYTQQSSDTLPAMTANDAPSGHIAVADGGTTFGAPANAWRAFNKDDAGTPDISFQDPATGYVQRKTPTAIRVWRFGIRARDGSANQAPKDFALYGSNNGSSFTLLVSVADQAGWGSLEQRFFDVPKASRGSYLYHRLQITANNGSAAASFNELYLLQEVRL